MRAHYAAEATGKTGALGELSQDVVKEDWMGRVLDRYRGSDRSGFEEQLERNWDRETKMGIEITSGSVFRAESKSVLGDLEGRISTMERTTPPSTPPRSSPMISPSTPIKTGDVEPHSIINWHQPKRKFPKLVVKAPSSFVKQLEKKLQQAVIEGDYDAADKIAASLASRFVESNTQLDPEFMEDIAEQYKNTLLKQARSGKRISGIAAQVAAQLSKPQMRLRKALQGMKEAGGSQPPSSTSPDDGLTLPEEEKVMEEPGDHIPAWLSEFILGGEEKKEEKAEEKVEEKAEEGPVPVVPQASRYVTLDALKLRQRLNAKLSYGKSSVLSVATKRHFATSWGGLAHRERRIPLFYGEILISGHNARITITRSGGGDISTINTFIKTFFLTGGSIKGKRMTSQQIIGYIMAHLPGTFSITT